PAPCPYRPQRARHPPPGTWRSTHHIAGGAIRWPAAGGGSGTTRTGSGERHRPCQSDGPGYAVDRPRARLSMLPPLKPIPIKERLSIVFVEKGEIDVVDGAFVVVDQQGFRVRPVLTHIPVGG